MMITIHGLAPKTKYQDVKLLIKQECKIDDFILDNLIIDSDGMKKVRVGLPDDNEGYKLMKCLNGYRMPGNFILKLVPVGKAAGNPNIQSQGGYDSRPGYQNQPRNEYSNQPRGDYPRPGGPTDYNREPHPSNPPRGSGGPHRPGGPHGSGGPNGAGGPHGPGGAHGPGGPHGPVGPHGPGGQHGPGGPHGAGGPHGPGGPPHANKPYGPGGHHGPMDNMRPSPWAGNNSSGDQWNSSMTAQAPQSSFSYASGAQQNIPANYAQQHPVVSQPRPDMRPYDQGRQAPPAESSYGSYPPKGNVPASRQPDLRQNLRNIDMMDSGSSGAPPQHGGRYPPSQYQQDKPLTQTQPKKTQPKKTQPKQTQQPLEQEKKKPEKPPPLWWCPELELLRKETRRTHNRAMNTKKEEDWKIHKTAMNTYKKRIRYWVNQERIAKETVTIMKDNFQGPTQYNINHPGGLQPQFQESSVSPWTQGHQSQPKAPFSKSSPLAYEDRKYPQGDQGRDPKNLQQRPDTYKEYEKRRGFSPSSRDPMRRSSPSRREDREPPGRGSDMIHRRPSPVQRRDDPHEMRYSPARKRVSPGPDRRKVPGHPGMRHDSPHKRPSPSRRLVSPSRRDDRPGSRYSPPRHADKLEDKYGPDGKDLKKVRPAYEPLPSHAQNQAMYSGGYRPSAHDNVQYPTSSMRQELSGPWQRHREEHTAPMKKQEEERRVLRMQLNRDRERIPDQAEKGFSPTRKSRSPNRRDRSPIRDRYKRNSPSSRSSYSPHRSWALEKRRSPDAPPPPVWPGQSDRTRPNRPNFTEKEEKPKHQPVWETRPFKEDEQRDRRPDDRRPFDEGKPRVSKDLMVREPVSQPGIKDRYQRDPKFSPRDDYDDRRDNYRRRDSPDRKNNREDFDLARRREDDNTDDYNRRRDSPRRERKQELPKDIDKDFEDIYNRAREFKRKTEERRKSASKKRDDFDEDRRHNENERGDIRQLYEDRSRYRDEESQRLREREDRPRDDRVRDDRLRDDRIRHEDDRRGEYRSRDIQLNEKEQHREVNEKPKRFFMSNNSTIKEKREKAIEDIAEKIIGRNEDVKHVQGEQRQRIYEGLKVAISKIVYDMFGDSDVSFIEIIIKYQARYDLKDEANILQDVMRSLPKQFRSIKRHAPESTEIPAKTSRHSPNADLKQGPGQRPKLSDSSFNVNLAPPSVINMPCIGVPQGQTIMNQGMVPMMVSAPFYQAFDNLQQNLQNPAYAPKPVQPVLDFMQSSVQSMVDYHQQMLDFQQPIMDFQQQPVEDAANPSFSQEDLQEGFRLYLCKDNFERITNMEADLLKDFLISQMFKATALFQGWSPDFTLKGLQSLYRYELVTKDEESKNWLLNLDFSCFEYFHVLVYTKEELWYERAAIWLPGHSRVRNIEPLEKLKLQNKKLEGVNIAKWKFVKKIVNEKGTRLYIDMPPSSARALEGHGMNLSYELQQVSVFPKAAAVDKDSFDAGLKEQSLTTPAEISEAIKNLPMPSLTNDPSLVKIILKGSKSLNLVEARKIKEVVIYNLFQYHLKNGISRTDFVKYGFLQPNYFAIAPLNQESKKWLLGCSFGKVNRQAVVVIGGEEDNTRFFRMHATVPQDHQSAGYGTLRMAQIIERLKSSNQGVKGINLSMWKPIKLKILDRKKSRFDVDIDMESLETLSTMRYQLDYVDSNGSQSLYFRSEYSQSGLEELIKKYKAEMTDSYDVANMDLESDQSNCDSNDDIICLD